MGKLIAVLVGAGVLAVVMTGMTGVATGNRVLETAASLFDTALGPSRCEFSMPDGSVVTVAPEDAAALTTAAATGGALPAGVEWPVGVTAEALAQALAAPEAVTCRIDRPRGLAAEELTDSGLTPRAQAVNDAVQATFGPIPDGGYAPGGVSTGHGARSAHYEGLAVDLFFRPVGDEAQRARGWTVANWLVTQAEQYRIAVLIFDDRIWSTRRSAEGWRPYTNPDGQTDPIGRHLDHIHVDVIAGDPPVGG